MILPNSHSNLTLDEKGLLSTMLNIPDADYCSAEYLANYTSTNVANIKSTLFSLQRKGYLLLVNNKYAINKNAINDMVFC